MSILILKLILIYVIPYVFLMSGVLYFAENKSDLDTVIVIISLLALVINNLSEDFLNIKSKTYDWAHKIYKYITVMFIIISVISVIFILIIPCVNNLSPINDPNYYSTSFFWSNIIFYLVLFFIGIVLNCFSEKWEKAKNLPYAIFWLFILFTYVASILIFYTKS